MLGGVRSALLAAAVATTLAAAPGRAHAGTGEALLRYLPDDTATILVIDVAHVRTGAALGRVVTLLRGHAARWNALSESVDLGRAVDTLVFAASPDHDGHLLRAMTIADGDVVQLLAHLHAPGAQAQRIAGILVYALPDGQAAIIDRHLVITAPGDMPAAIERARRTPAEIGAALDRGRTTATLRTLLDATDGGTDLRGGVLVDASSRALISQQLGAEPAWVAFAIAASERASVELRFAFADEHAATTAAVALRHLAVGTDAQIRATLEATIGPEFVDSLDVGQDHDQVRLSAGMTADEADRLGNLLGAFL
jgi:hypothetical protein